MRDRRRSLPPKVLEGASADVQAANEVLRAIFLAILDAGLTQAEFAEKVCLSERTIENWRASSALTGDTKGPGLLLVSRALDALGLELDVRAKSDRKRFPLGVRNAVAEDERLRIARGMTVKAWLEEHSRWVDGRRRMGLASDDD